MELFVFIFEVILNNMIQNRLLNICFIIIVGILTFLYIKGNDLIYFHIMGIFYFLYYIISKLIFYFESKKSILLIKLKNKTIRAYLYSFIPGIIGISLIINYYFEFFSLAVSLNTIILYVGFALVFESIYTLQNVIFITDKILASKHEGGRYTKWEKISEYCIEDELLIIRTSYKLYKFPYKEISREELKTLLDILNEKLKHVFKGELFFENNEIKVIS